MVETEDYLLKAPVANLRFGVPLGWKPSARDGYNDEWVLDTADDLYTIYVKLDPIAECDQSAATREKVAGHYASIAEKWSREGDDGFLRIDRNNGIIRYLVGQTRDDPPHGRSRFFTVGRVFDRAAAGMRCIRITLVCDASVSDDPFTKALLAHCESEAERLAGCIAGFACRKPDDVVYRQVTGASEDGIWIGRLPLDWDFCRPSDTGWESRSPDGEHLVSIWHGKVLAPDSDKDDPEERRLAALISFYTERLHALDIEGDVEISHRQGGHVWAVHGRFFDGHGEGRKLVRRWYGLVPVDGAIVSVQFNYAVPVHRGSDPDVTALAGFFEEQAHGLLPETRPKSPLH